MFNLLKTGLWLMLIALLMSGCANGHLAIGDWIFSGEGNLKHDTSDMPLCIIRPKLTTDTQSHYVNEGYDSLGLYCSVRISYDKTQVDSSRINSLSIQSLDYNKSIGVNPRFSSKEKKKDYGYTKDKKPINYLTDNYKYQGVENRHYDDIPLSSDRKKLDFTVYVNYKIFAKDGSIFEKRDSINVIAKKVYIDNNTYPNMWMNKPMMPTRF